MRRSDIPFGTTDWSTVEATEHRGEAGHAVWHTQRFGAVRVRMVEYSAGYRADHCCEKAMSCSASRVSWRRSFETGGGSGSVRGELPSRRRRGAAPLEDCHSLLK